MKTEAEALAAQTLPMKNSLEVDEFLNYFRAPHHRRPMLAIVGGTNLGKSMLAADVLRRLGGIVGAAEVLELTVEQSQHLDLADFEWDRHAGVLFDGVGDAFILKLNREALQGRAKLCKGGQSATNVYSYTYTLVNRGIVAIFDLSASNLTAFERDHWLSNRKNVIRLNLNEPAFVPAPSTPRGAGSAPAPAPRPSPELGARVKRRWVSAAPGLA